MKIAVTTVKPFYCQNSPFHPSSRYPEIRSPISEVYNPVYEGVREIFRLLNLDIERYGAANWNPLGKYIKPGDTVLVKPNWVLSRSREGGSLSALVTHPSLIRAVVDYALIAVGPTGKVIVADAPQYDCNWDELMEKTGMKDLANWYGSRVEFLDLRPYWSEKFHWWSKIQKLKGDPLGESEIDLKELSKLEELEGLEKLYGAAPWVDETRGFHQKGKHTYVVSNTFLNADALILLPKLKTHKKAGITCCAKSLVGVITNKNSVPHFRVGIDQFPPNISWRKKLLSKLEMFMYTKFLNKRSRVYDFLYRTFYGFWVKDLLNLKLHPCDRGAWYGNDTLWRVIYDLLAILESYGPKKVFCLVDAVVAGEGEGPLAPNPVHLGLLIGGESPESIDWWIAQAIGFDPQKLRLKRPRDATEVIGNVPKSIHRFRPPQGWIGYL